MGKLETIYNHAPIFVQNAMCTGKGLLNYKDRYLHGYRRWRAFCADFDTWTLDQKLEYQRQRLVEFVRFAAENSPFYRRLYAGIDLSTFSSVEDLKRLPVVDKEMLRTSIEDVYTVPARGSVVGHTGGTTGKSLVYRFTRGDLNERMAVLDHFKSRVGFEHRKMRRASFNASHIVPSRQNERVYWRCNAACKQMIYSSFDLTEEKLGAYVESLNRFKPEAIDGYFTSIRDVASFIDRHNLTLSFRPIAIFPTSETVDVHGRELVGRVFGCELYDQYASSEGAPFVCECRDHRLHVELNTGVFEQDEKHGLLVTSFSTHGTPLIRYAIGDAMDFAPVDETCSCGLAGPLVEGIRGRELDFLYRADGTKIYAVNVVNPVHDLPNSVVKAQFRQTKMGEATVLLVVDAALFDEKSARIILDEATLSFGRGFKLNLQIVDEIPRAASGKHRLIVNEVDA